MGLSLSHVLLVLVVILIVFGAGKLPSVMGDLAKGMRAFRDGMKEGSEPEKQADGPPSKSRCVGLRGSAHVRSA